MPEVLEIVKKSGLLAGLFWFAIKDYKTGMLSSLCLWVFVGIGTFFRFLTGNASICQLFLCASIGIGCLFICLLTAESLGRGDGLLFLGTGLFLEFEENFVLLCGTLLLVGGFSGICLLLKKKSRKDRIPLVPFVLTAYVLFLL